MVDFLANNAIEQKTWRHVELMIDDVVLKSWPGQKHHGKVLLVKLPGQVFRRKHGKDTTVGCRKSMKKKWREWWDSSSFFKCLIVISFQEADECLQFCWPFWKRFDVSIFCNSFFNLMKMLILFFFTFCAFDLHTWLFWCFCLFLLVSSLPNVHGFVPWYVSRM